MEHVVQPSVYRRPQVSHRKSQYAALTSATSQPMHALLLCGSNWKITQEYINCFILKVSMNGMGEFFNENLYLIVRWVVWKLFHKEFLSLRNPYSLVKVQKARKKGQEPKLGRLLTSFIASFTK